MLQLFVKTITGETIDIKVEPNDSIIKIKDEISKKKDIHPKQQKLMFNGKELIDNRKINECGIENYSTIHLIIRITGINIFIIDENNKKITLYVDQDDTIENVKKLYYEKTQEQITFLNFHGVPMKNEKKIKDYGLQNDCTLQVNKRLKGGKNKII